MRTMSRFWMALVVSASLGLTFFWTTPAKAVELSNTAISWNTFLSWTDADNDGVPDFDPLYPPLTFPFDFGGPNFPDGSVFSAVYPGVGQAAGKWVYVYQIQHLTTSDVPVLNGMSWFWMTNPTLDAVDSISSFKITSGAPTIGFGLGTVDITDADWYPHPINPTADFDFAPQAGQVTYIFGLFSSLPPMIVDATVRDAVTLATRPLVYSPTPEPSTFLLIGMGLVGTLMWRRRRK